MRVTLWGTRGSLPSPGPENARHGGNTSCVEVRGTDGTLLVLDAGSGIRRLGDSLEPELKRLDLLLTHLHTDHIQGLGFFHALERPGLEAHIWGPPSTTLDLGARLTRYLSPPLFPVRLRDLPSSISLHDTPFGDFEIGPFKIAAALVCHPGPTVGYRITEGRVSMAYLPDHEPALGSENFQVDPVWTSGYDLAKGVDLLIHDAQYSESEYAEHLGWGHSSVRHALTFAGAVGARRLVAFHHDPAHDDAMLDRLLEEARGESPLPFELVPGTEGATFEL